ncbi:MAG: UMP kinase [Candidatus Paceibacteria bacterium]
MEEERIVISLGGSLIVPEDIDSEFVKKFKETILSHIKAGKKFVIITGGGRTSRKYTDALSVIMEEITTKQLDWLGIYATRLNAHMLQMAIGEEYAKREIIENLDEEIDFSTPVRIGGGTRPGHSSDGAAVEIARKIGAKTIINLSNIDHVYDSDPRKNTNATKFEKISWDQYIDLIPKEWSPGLSTPFDPIASREAREAGIQVVIMNGKPTDNLDMYLSGGKLEGTLIS